MPLNLIKKYNELLDFGAYTEYQRRMSLKGVFDRDFTNNPDFRYRAKPIQPTPQNGEIPMETLFTHLTTVITDYATRKRTFDIDRSVRLHWVKYHLQDNDDPSILHFSVKEPNGFRTYVYDKAEKYVIILEPLRKINEYYLLTAYYLRGKDAKRDKIMKKYKRKLDEIL